MSKDKDSISFSLTARQSIAFNRLTDDCTRYILYGGAKGGGKSWLLCLWVLHWCRHLINILDIKPSFYPPTLGFIGRKQRVDFTMTTLETFKKVIPHNLYKIRDKQGEIILFNRVKILFGGLDKQETINKFNSAELAFFAIDQAEEVERKDINVLKASLRFKINNKKPTYKELYTANPSDCWLIDDFIDNRSHSENRVFIPALPSDNPHLPDDYIQTLEESFKHAPELLRAYRDGDWTALKATNSLFSQAMFDKLKDKNINFNDTKKIISCDPATSHDECVIYVFENYKKIDEKILIGIEDGMLIAGHIVHLAREHKIYNFVIDSIGLGHGTAKRVKEIDEKFNVIEVTSKKGDNMDPMFFNKRAEIYWTAKRRVMECIVGYPEDSILRRQLLNTHYKIANSKGQIQIEGKDKIKRVLGMSPDRADAWVYGIWAHDHYVEAKKRGSYSMEDLDYSLNPATV